MEERFSRVELVQVVSLVVLALITRLLPHPPNFAPITSIALFSGVYFSNKRLAIVLPIVCMIVTDFYLGFHSLLPVVYFAFLLISILGIYMKKIGVGSILLSSTLFFIITNFGVWLVGYPLTLEGFLTCYTLAIPFFVNALLGDFFYSTVFLFSLKKFRESRLGYL